MPLSIEEARRRYIEAVIEEGKQKLLNQWYYALHDALKRQKRTGTAEPDFRQNWLLNDTYWPRSQRIPELVSSRDYLSYVREWISDQLDEYGLVLTPITVTNGIDSVDRIYLLRPGQKPDFNPAFDDDDLDD